MKIRRSDILRKHEGMALIAVVFLLIVIGALGFTISSVMQNQGSEVGLQLTANCADYSASAGARYRAQSIADAGVIVVAPAASGNVTMNPISGTLPSNCSVFATSVSGTWPNLKILSQVQ